MEKLSEATKTLAAWVVSLFRNEAVVAGFGKLPSGRRYAKVFRHGALAMVPLIMGAAFTVLEVDLPAQAAAGAALVTELGDVPSAESQQNWQIARVSLVAPSLVTGVVTNNATINFRYWRGGANQGTYATYTLSAGNNLAADTEVVLAATAGIVLQAGDVLDVQQVQNGTGLALPAGILAKVEIQ